MYPRLLSYSRQPDISPLYIIKPSLSRAFMFFTLCVCIYMYAKIIRLFFFNSPFSFFFFSFLLVWFNCLFLEFTFVRHLRPAVSEGAYSHTHIVLGHSPLQTAFVKFRMEKMLPLSSYPRLETSKEKVPYFSILLILIQKNKKKTNYYSKKVFKNFSTNVKNIQLFFFMCMKNKCQLPV